MRRVTGPENDATCFATANATSSSCSSGTTLETNPATRASSALKARPVKNKSIAICLPTTRGSRCVPPAPGIAASVISGWQNFAVAAAMTISHISTNSQPPPAANPLTATITGFEMSGKLETQPMNLPAIASSAVISAISRMSAPAQKCLSADEIRIARTLSVFSKSQSATSISWQNSRLSALSTPTRFNVI